MLTDANFYTGNYMKTRSFINDPEIQQLLISLKTEIKDKQFSDIIDNKGNQYVDLVQEGGGVLGVALLGYTYVLEKMGIRFFSLAGTSAGAINALLLASCGTIEKQKTAVILELMLDQDLTAFIDGPLPVKKFVNAVRNNSYILLKLFWGALCLPHLFKYKGLNPGEEFRKWTKEILSRNQIRYTVELEDLRNKPVDIKIREGINKSINDLRPKLKIIAAEIKTESRVIFPEMNLLFWNDGKMVNPSEYLRASMSIPVFFHPYKVKIGDNVKKEDWYQYVRYKGPVPDEAVFQDGGILSNFPIDVFHNRNIVPRLPTFGVKLGNDRVNTDKINSISALLLSIFNSSRHVLDYQFLLNNEDYEQLITRINVKDFNWLNFSISDKDKLALFRQGAFAAADFLKKFDWEKYKETRKTLIPQSQNS
jgi:NTE family protein